MSRDPGVGRTRGLEVGPIRDLNLDPDLIRAQARDQEVFTKMIEDRVTGKTNVVHGLKQNYLGGVLSWWCLALLDYIVLYSIVLHLALIRYSCVLHFQSQFFFK